MDSRASGSALGACSRALEGWSWGSSSQELGESCTKSKSSRRRKPSSKRAGPAFPAGETCAPSQLGIFPPATCSSGGSLVRTSASQPLDPRELACAVLALASGRTWRESLALRGQSGSWSRTWRMAWTGGSPPSWGTWSGSGMRRYQSGLRAAGSGLPTSVAVASCLPTPTASSYGSSNNGCPGDGREQYAKKGKPSLSTMARMQGGSLDPRFVEWMMGFPPDWTLPAFGR